MKKTWWGHPDYNDLVGALEKVQETARYVNDRASEAEQLAKVYVIQNQIVGKFEVRILFISNCENPFLIDMLCCKQKA